MTDWSSIGRRSKRRGKTYERRCAKILMDFTSTNFRSTPASGGFNKQGGVVIREELFCGDLICDNPDFRYCIEAKNREDFSFVALLKNPSTASFTKWWYQCVMDARLVKLKPLMFFKPNNRDDFVVMTLGEWDRYYAHEDCSYFEINCYNKPLTFTVEEKNSKGKKVKKEITKKLPSVVMVDWKQFVRYHKPEQMFYNPVG